LDERGFARNDNLAGKKGELKDGGCGEGGTRETAAAASISGGNGVKKAELANLEVRSARIREFDGKRKG